MRQRLLNLGTLRFLIIPEPFIDALGLHDTEEVELTLSDDSLTIARVAPHPREGWAEAAKLIGAEPLSAEALEWLDASLTDNAELGQDWPDAPDDDGVVRL